MTAERTYDELAGVVDLFGALTRAELRRALSELAFKRGESTDEDALSGAIPDAVEGYYLVECDPEAVAGEDERTGGEGDGEEETDGEGGGERRLLTAGPVAFPTLPPKAEDLPHILDVPTRDPDRGALGEQVRDRFRGDAARAIDAGDAERVERLLDVSYDLEAWAPVDVSAERERLDAVLAEE